MRAGQCRPWPDLPEEDDEPLPPPAAGDVEGVLPAALVIHGIGYLCCLDEPRFFDLWLVRVRHCPRIRNHRFWRGNAYRP